MGIVSRFGDIMKSNVNAILDKLEDPSKMIDQMLIDARNDLAKVKKETAGVMANEKSAKRKVDECEADIKKYLTAAQNAIKAGQEDDARELLAKKQQLEEKLVSLKENYTVAHDTSEKMRQMHDKLVSDIENMEDRRDAAKAKMATAKAQQTINKMTAGNKAASSIAKFDRMEEKANKMLDSAEAEADLNAGTTTTDELAAKYATASSTSVDDELAKLKADMGME